jgi:hypothetical protein
MRNNREIPAALGVLAVGWIFLGYTIGYFAQAGLPASDLWITFVTTALVLIFTPAVMLKARWTALGAVIAGIIYIIPNVIALAAGVPMSLLYGPVIAVVLGLFFTYFSFRAYQQK